MTDFSALPLGATTLTAIGTTAALMAVLLVLLRAKIQERPPVVALTQLWAGTSTPASGVVLALLSVIAISCFAYAPEFGGNNVRGADERSIHAAAQAVQSVGSVESADQDLGSLRAYAGEIGAKGDQPATAAPPASKSAEVPDVDVMIAKLVARLETQPDDVKGWKMLGWSYLNTDRPEDAAKAYEKALKLAPGDADIKKGLETAKSARTASTKTPSSGAAVPVADSAKAADASSDAQRDGMIRGMVDQLATRLEAAPNDEDGWLRLMRSRMTLGERDAAKAALTKALATFASDAAATARLSAAARDLGVESN